ncbi:hypothetical protein Mal52_48120 [Symmachiella dynata]|uniref:Uncharacterized protein n=1 Tax=Symmachiella dynata TaxID=2527995 RepID=A0A517ZUX8_9PLAN|nr:hypothetical protein Mal52_48120 [Symmachiella dynata]
MAKVRICVAAVPYGNRPPVGGPLNIQFVPQLLNVQTGGKFLES